MRDLTAAQNSIEIKDGQTGDIHLIYYRRPTAKEIAEYQAKSFERKGRKVINRVHATRLELGKKIITGFEPGTIGIDNIAISPVSTDAGYRADWKELLCDLAPDVLAAMAQQVFEGTGVSMGDVEMVYEGEDEVVKSNIPLASGQMTVNQTSANQ